MVSQAELISKGYRSLVSGLTSIFLEKVWIPLKDDRLGFFYTGLEFRQLGQYLTDHILVNKMWYQ